MSGAITAGTIAAAGIGAAGSIGSALIGSNAAGNAASAQQNAAQKAAALQQQGSTNALNYQNGIYGQTEQNLNPYINAGGGALSQLQYLLGTSPTSSGSMVQGAQGFNSPSSPQIPQTGAPQSGATGMMPGGQYGAPSLSGGPASPLPSGSSLSLNGGATGLMNPGGYAQASGGPQMSSKGAAEAAPGSAAGGGAGGFGSLLARYGQFQAPDAITMQNDPGYQARMQMGTDAIQRSAAARGGVLTGGTAKALDQFGQDYASNEYGNVYNRALGSYDTNYGVWNNDNNNAYSRLMGLAGSGQQAATNLGQFGQASSNNITGNLLGTGQQIGQDYGAGAAANASGIVGSANAWGGAVGGIGNNLSQLLMLKSLGGGSSSGGTWI